METPGQQTEQEEAAEPAASAPPTDGAAEAAPQEAVELDLAELQGKARERDEFLALAQRTQADFENFRKRMSRDVAAAEQRGVAKVVRELLPALDNLERALGAAEAPGAGGHGTEHHLAEGIRLVQAELSAAIARIGVEAYSPEGEPFDPTVHEAVAQHPVDGAESGTVVEVLQKGYRSGDLILRPARVVVAG